MKLTIKKKNGETVEYDPLEGNCLAALVTFTDEEKKAIEDMPEDHNQLSSYNTEKLTKDEILMWMEKHDPDPDSKENPPIFNKYRR